MNKLKLIIFIILISGSTTIISQEHPWEKYGFNPKIITLSKGKYQEFHDNDTIIEIGSVIFDRKNGKIIGIVEADTSTNCEIIKPSIISRWISPDPHAENYLNWSPYNYVADNPIMLIDPDGRDWEKSVDENGNVHYTVTVQVRNSANISQEEMNEKLAAIQESFSSIFTGAGESGTSYSFTLNIDYNNEDAESDDFYIDFVNEVKGLKNTSDEKAKGAAGGVDETGNMETNRILILANRDADETGVTGAHELGHTGGLYHASMGTDAFGYPVAEDNVMIPSDKKTGSVTSNQRDRINQTFERCSAIPYPDNTIKSKSGVIKQNQNIDINKLIKK
jgi:hypothetical protein